MKILSDNSTAILYVNNMGGKLEPFDDLAKNIWEFCISKNLWITACFIPGTDNITADWKSRKFNDDIEWQLAPSAFKQVFSLVGFNPEIDLFATYLNHQLDRYVVSMPDPGAVATDAFSLNWKNLKFYCFPPFSVNGCIISKS